MEFKNFYISESFGKPSGLSREVVLEMINDDVDAERTDEEKESIVDEVIDFFDSLPNNITAYRAVSLKSFDDFRKDNIGESWTIDAPTAVEFGNHANCNYVIIAEFKKNDIDMKQSAKSYIQFSSLGTSESEFELYIPFSEEKAKNIRLITMKQAKSEPRYIGGGFEKELKY